MKKLTLLFTLIALMGNLNAQCYMQGTTVDATYNCGLFDFTLGFYFGPSVTYPVIVHTQNHGDIIIPNNNFQYNVGFSFFDNVTIIDNNGCYYQDPNTGDTVNVLYCMVSPVTGDQQINCAPAIHNNMNESGNFQFGSVYYSNNTCFAGTFGIGMPNNSNLYTNNSFFFNDANIDALWMDFNGTFLSENYGKPEIADYFGTGNLNVSHHQDATWQWYHEGVPVVNSDTSWVSGALGGFYECMVQSNQLGCTYNSDKYLHLGNKISGNAFYDVNSNGIKDASERFANQILITTNNNQLAYSLYGNYMMEVPAGTYTINAVAPQHFVSSTTQNATFPTNTGGNDNSNNFPLTLGAAFSDLTPYIFSSRFRPGFPINTNVTVKNIGNQDMNGVLTVTLDPLFQFTSSVPAPTSVNGQVLTFNLSTIPFQDLKNVSINGNLSASVTLGNVLTISSTITNALDNNTANNTSSQNVVVVGSYDPNDKIVSPAGDITTLQVANNQSLEYIIRFQNTGTDTAFKVVLLDTLSNNIDINSIEVIDASHNFTLDIFNSRMLRVSFQDIMLPHKAQNEAASQGYFRFKVKVKNTLVVNDEVKNTAHIYFDFNQPIVTNTTVTKVTTPQSKEIASHKMFNVYPNPTKNNLMIESNEKGLIEYSITNLLGEEIMKGNYSDKINVQNLVSGFYLIEVQQNGIKSVYKFNKE